MIHFNHKILILLPVLPLLVNCGKQDRFQELNALAGQEYLVPVRPFTNGRNQCWNKFATKFIYAPVFDVQSVEGAREYKFTVTADDGKTHYFVADAPTKDLSPIWDSIEPGHVRLEIEAFSDSGESLGVIHSREFLRDFPFKGPYNANVRPYGEAALMGALYVHHMKGVQDLKTSAVPDDEKYAHFAYPNKIIGSLVEIECIIAYQVPSLKDEALTIARNAAKFLIDASRPEGSPLEYFSPTYYGDKLAAGYETNIGKTMTLDALFTANAFLSLYDATGEGLYMDRALKIADTYAKIQNPDGSFPIKVDFHTGEPENASCAMLGPVLLFVRRLQKDYGITKYDEMAARAAEWMKKVALESFDFTGQFEDVSVSGLEPYQNLTNCTAAQYASYLLTGDMTEEVLQDAIDILRFSEDQFVHWDILDTENGVRKFASPCVFEQYSYQMPVDNSTCVVANAYLDLYAVTGDELAFEKAKALIDNLTVVQDISTGMIPTTFEFDPEKRQGYNYWLNCSLASISTLMRMAHISK